MKITKIYDHDCPICAHMATFENNVIFNLESKPDFEVKELGVLLNPVSDNNWDVQLAGLVELHACNPDYTIDLPVYMVTEGKTYLGHAVGELTATELRTKLQEIISAAADKQSQTVTVQ